MSQTNAIFNIFNQNQLLAQHKNSHNYIWKVSNKSLDLWFASPRSNKHDLLNNHTSGYNLTNKLKKKVSVNFFRNSFLTQWARIAFRGKSFRIRNFCAKNKFTFNFGYSHWTRLKLMRNWGFFKRRRQSYVIYTWNYKDFKNFSRFFPYIRFYNCYTMRGLRLKRQPIIRRFGKISQHISILH
jgi:hypothetical protein